MEWFFYDLVILIKLYKIRYLTLDKALFFRETRLFVWKIESLTHNFRSKKHFSKNFLIIDIAKDSGFCSNKNAKFSVFQEEVEFFHPFLFHI